MAMCSTLTFALSLCPDYWRMSTVWSTCAFTGRLGNLTWTSTMDTPHRTSFPILWKYWSFSTGLFGDTYFFIQSNHFKYSWKMCEKTSKRWTIHTLLLDSIEEWTESLQEFSIVSQSDEMRTLQTRAINCAYGLHSFKLCMYNSCTWR